MQASQVPSKIPLPFATSGTKNTIPETTAGIGAPGNASFDVGFPAVTMLPVVSGGIPPYGADFNGILFDLASIARWANAGGFYKFDGTFSGDTNVGGYPAGAVLLAADASSLWLNTVDNNTTNPDLTSSVGWVILAAYGVSPITGLTNANVTLTPAQYNAPVITLAGTLTSNLQIIFPATQNQWLVINNTTGAFALTCKTVSGTGAIVAQAGGQQIFWGDGTNLNPLAGNSAIPLTVGTATTSQHAVQAGQVVSGSLGTATAAGTANAITASFAASPIAFVSGQQFTIISTITNTGAMAAVITLGGTAQSSVPIVKANNQPVVAGDFPAGYPGEFAYSSSFGALVMNNPATGVSASTSLSSILSITTPVLASNAMTLATPAMLLDFPAASLTTGTSIPKVSVPALTCTIPSVATIGTINAQPSTLILLIAYNAGVPVLCVVNLAGGVNLDESTLISPTTISSGATANNVIYSASAVAANSPFRVVGAVTSTQATAGTWVTAPTLVHGTGGQYLAAMSSIGYGQTPQNLTGSRAYTTTYYAPPGKPIFVNIQINGSSSASLNVNGVVVSQSNASSISTNIVAIIPPGMPYSLTGGGTIQLWTETR